MKPTQKDVTVHQFEMTEEEELKNHRERLNEVEEWLDRTFDHRVRLVDVDDTDSRKIIIDILKLIDGFKSDTGDHRVDRNK